MWTRKSGGQRASNTLSGIDTGKTQPLIAPVSRTPANSSGWNNTDVALTWSCADNLSGPVSASITQVISAEGAGQPTVGLCTDRAGNISSNTQSGINIDKTLNS